jgi:hypothetical protein
VRRIQLHSNGVRTEIEHNATTKTCGHRGDQIRTMTSDICGSRGQNLPVYSCELHGECTHRQVCKGQDDSVAICVGCDDGPWSFRYH